MSSGTWPSAAGYGREESTNEAITLPIASGWLRLAAWLVDGVIASVIGFIGGLVFGVLELATRIESLGFLFLALIVAYPVILTIMVANRGQSPGKIIVGIKIVRQDGRRLGYGLAILREWIGKFISALILYLGFIWILFDEKRQGWHGKFADTVVVRVP